MELRVITYRCINPRCGFTFDDVAAPSYQRDGCPVCKEKNLGHYGVHPINEAERQRCLTARRDPE